MPAQAGVVGLDITLINLRHSTMSVHAALPHAVEAAGDEYAARVRRAIRHRDHTLAQLAAMDHPYARRHGAIQIHVGSPWIVHRQSGRMLSALQAGLISNSPAYEVTFDYGAAPHAAHVILGTRVMLGRDTLWQVAQLPTTRVAMMRAVVKRLGAELRTKLGVRFGSTAPGGTALGMR